MKWLLLILITSCAQVTSLNLRKHQFGLLPTKIIWFQVAGLEEEQIAFLRFQDSSEKRTSFEDNICFGQSWSYNLYQVRNSAENSFLAQMTGKKNIKNSCEDASLRPIWNYISPNGYTTAILESGAVGLQSLLSFQECGDVGNTFLNEAMLFLRTKPKVNMPTFHYSEDVSIANKISFDRACGEHSCDSTIIEDFKAIYPKFLKTSQKHLFIVRDFSYLNALEKKDFVKAREILLDLERSYREALRLTDSNDYLVMLSTGDSRFIDMPDQGKGWYEFEKFKKNVSTKRSKLTNLVIASGSRAENFCGMYEDANIFERILSGPKQQGLELQIINPFK